MIGLYDLSHSPTTFDFVVWCAIAKTHGVNHVRFCIDGRIDTRKYDDVTGWRRFGNINAPICRLFGLTFSMSEKRDGREFKYLYGHANQTYRAFGRIETIPLSAPRSDYITITLRESFRHSYRDSNKAAWLRVQKELESRGKRVFVIHDCERAPMLIEDRMALYAGAEMNLGVANGPMALCHYSAAPYITFNMAPVRPQGETSYDCVKLMASSGFMLGDQLLWRNERQLLVWEPDSFENIMEAYERMEAEAVHG